MRLAYIVENYGVKSETFVTDLINGLANSGIEVSVLVDKILGNRKYPTKDYPIIETGFCTRYQKPIFWMGLATKTLGNQHLTMSLRKTIARHSLIRQLEKFKPDVAYIDHGNNAVLAYESLNELDIPFVVHFHGRDATRLMALASYRREIGKVFDYSQKVIVASNHIKRRLALMACPISKISVIRLGIDISKLPLRSQRTVKTSHPSVIHVGRLVEKKDPVALLYAFRLVLNRISEAKLTMIGSGALLNRIRNAIKDLQLADSVRLLGALPRDEVLNELCRHWVYAQHCVTASTGDQEGFSVSMLEAAACGLPVVSTIHNGIPENVIDNQTGFLVQEHDYESMAERMIRLLEDPDLCEKMGMAGRCRVEEHFLLETRIKKINKVLRDICR